ncbi:MAG: hypothetical protein JWO76_1923 [Nocardioides sp.]|nr:hypothetical protein [Nocardioides sp.]
MSTHEAEYTARLEALTARLEREAADGRRSLEQSQERRAEAARAGELGRDWQDVQRRVDAGQTTLTAVFTGEDDSPEARRLVALSQRNLAEAREQLPERIQEELAAAEVEFARIGRGPTPPRLATDDPGDSPS